MKLNEQQKNCPYCHQSVEIFDDNFDDNNVLMKLFDPDNQQFIKAWRKQITNVIPDAVHGLMSGDSIMVWRRKSQLDSAMIAYFEMNPLGQMELNASLLLVNFCPVCGRELGVETDE